MKHESQLADDVSIECDLPHSPEQVWRAITDEDLLCRWLTPTDLRPEVGAQFRLSAESSDRSTAECEILEAVPQRTLRWRQREREGEEDSLVESVVTLELLPTEFGTRLRVIHDQFRRIAPVSCATHAAATGSRQRSRTTEIVCVHGAWRKAA